MNLYHITWATHNSRISKRMVFYKVKVGKAIWLDSESEIFITQCIHDVILEDGLKCLAYNICGDHIHMVLACDSVKLSRVVQKIKAISSRKHNIWQGITIPISNTACCVADGDNGNKIRGITQNHLWTRRFSTTFINSERQLRNTLFYIQHNREKHGLPPNKKLETIIRGMLSDPREFLE